MLDVFKMLTKCDGSSEGQQQMTSQYQEQLLTKLKFTDRVSKAHIEVCLLWREGRSLLCILPAFELSEHCLLSVIGVSERAVMSESSDELESSGRAPNCQDSMGKKCRGRLIEHNVLLQYVSTYREQLCFTKCLNRRWLVPYLTDPV